MVRSTDRHLLQAAGQAGGGDAMSGSLGVVQALQRATNTVATRQRRPAASLLLPRCLALQEAQGVRLHRLGDQTRNRAGKEDSDLTPQSVNPCGLDIAVCCVPLMSSRPVT